MFSVLFSNIQYLITTFTIVLIGYKPIILLTNNNYYTSKKFAKIGLSTTKGGGFNKGRRFLR